MINVAQILQLAGMHRACRWLPRSTDPAGSGFKLKVSGSESPAAVLGAEVSAGTRTKDSDQVAA